MPRSHTGWLALIALSLLSCGSTEKESGFWIQRQSGTAVTLFGAGNAAGVAVAVGALGTVLISGDGTGWIIRSAGTPYPLYAVAGNGTTFVAVGGFGTIVTSADGVAWTARTSGTTSDLRGVAWSGTRFVVVGDAGTIVTSNDGVTWSATNLASAIALKAISAGGPLLVAVGEGIVTSPDGLTWTEVPSGPTTNGVVWSGVQYVAVGPWVGQGNAWTSFDGVTWRSQQTTVGNAMQAVAWTGSQFVAVGTARVYMTSPDGITWRGFMDLAGASDLFGATAFAGRVIAVGSDGTILNTR